MKKIIVAVIGSLVFISAYSQDMTKFKLYKPEEKAEQEIAAAVKQAKTEGKHVFIQIGGNWCIWCARFHDFVSSDAKIDSIIKAGYVVYHLNYSEGNKNYDLLEKYGFPNRFGFPVFLILNSEGKLIHTQDSALLEEGKSYNKDKVVEFLENWTPKAIDPKKYDWIKRTNTRQQ